MRYSNCAFSLVTACVLVGYVTSRPDIASAQTTHSTAVTADSLRTFAENLKQDLQDGSILLADIHAVQLRLALLGALSEHTAANVNALEERLQERPGPDKPEPQLTAGLVPLADKLIQALDEPGLGLAKKYSEQLEVQIQAQLELYLRKQVESDKT